MSTVIENTFVIVAILSIVVIILKHFGDALQEELLVSSGKIWILMPGTIIHELSHLFFVLLFGLHVDDVSLFHFDQETGELGSVSYSYNSHSIKDRIGVTLSSVAPIFGITAFEYLGYWFLFKDHVKVLMNDALENNLIDFIKDFFMTGSLTKMILFILLSSLFLSGYSISSEDVHGILSGILFLISFIFVLCLFSTFFTFISTSIYLYVKLLLFFSIPMIIISIIMLIILKTF